MIGIYCERTTDELYLVDNKKVEPFAGDLDDYHKWLSEQQRIEKQAHNSQKKVAVDNVSRKEQKRLDAVFRQKLTPYKKQLQTAEKKMDIYSQRLTEIENALVDSTLYGKCTKKAVNGPLLKEQGELKEKLEDAEMLWMDAQEKIELMQSEFDGK